MWATVAAGIPGAAKESRFESHSSVPPVPTRSTCSSSLSGSDPWPLPSFGDQGGDPYNHQLTPKMFLKPGMVAHAFNSCTLEAEAGRYLSVRTARTTYKDHTQEDLVSKNFSIYITTLYNTLLCV